MMKKKLLGAMLSAFCLGPVVACKPQERLKPDVSAETAEVEGNIQKFKATPNRENMEEADRALADMNAKIKELEAREPQVGGAEKDKTVAASCQSCALRTTSTRSRSHP
jgi:TolA-binding protein